MKHAAFLKQITDFVFVENEPEKADIIFIPGSGFPQLAEEAAQLYKKGFAPIFFRPGVIVLHRDTLVVYRKRKRFIRESTIRNGNFSAVFW